MSNEESQFNLQGYNIVTLVKRLEAATSRLEDVTIFQEEVSKQSKGDTDGAVLTGGSSGENAPVKAIKGSAPEKKAKYVLAYEDLIASAVLPFVEISKDIDSVLLETAELFKGAFEAQSNFIEVSSKSKKPELSDSVLVEAVNPINEKITKIGELKDKNRKSPYYNHLNTVAEGSAVLGWVFSDVPVSLIPEFKDSAQFWSNRVVKEFKDKDERHTKWVSAFFNIFDELRAYAKEYHTTGLSWNAKGAPLAESLKEKPPSGSSAPASGGSGGPPPPPPPPPPPASVFDGDSSKDAGGINAVFADLNQGEHITSSLKKVDRSQMTHKNPALRKDATVAAKKPAPPKKPLNLSSGGIKKKPAKKELIDGTKWVIENFTEADTNGTPIVIETEMYQSIFIGNCSGITIQFKGKANALSISETKNVGVVVDSLVSGVDVIKSYRFGIQITDLVPMVNVDKSDEGSLYLSQKSIDANIQIFSSCTTAFNILVPSEDEFSEIPAPEQFRSTIKNGKIVTEIVEHAG